MGLRCSRSVLDPKRPRRRNATETYRAMFEDLPRTLTRDPERARVVLKRLLQEVRLVPSAAGLVAEVRVPVRRLVALMGRRGLQNSSGSGVCF